AADRHSSVLAPAEGYEEVGFNFRMTDLHAAVGLVQLERLPGMITRRRELAAVYARGLAGADGLRPVNDPSYGRCDFQSYRGEGEPGCPLDRDELLGRLAEHGISARRGTMAPHGQPP